MTRTEKIKISLDFCLQTVKQAIKAKDAVSLFTAMYTIEGALTLCDMIELPEVRKMYETDPIIDTFYELCKKETERT